MNGYIIRMKMTMEWIHYEVNCGKYTWFYVIDGHGENGKVSSYIK